jgi:hypothetical protein
MQKIFTTILYFIGVVPKFILIILMEIIAWVLVTPYVIYMFFKRTFKKRIKIIKKNFKK